MNVDTDTAFNGVGHMDEAATAKDFSVVVRKILARLGSSSGATTWTSEGATA